MCASCMVIAPAASWTVKPLQASRKGLHALHRMPCFGSGLLLFVTRACKRLVLLVPMFSEGAKGERVWRGRGGGAPWKH